MDPGFRRDDSFCPSEPVLSRFRQPLIAVEQFAPAAFHAAFIAAADLGGALAEPVTFTEGKPSPLLKCAWTATLSKGEYTGLKKLCLDA